MYVTMSERIVRNCLKELYVTMSGKIVCNFVWKNWP